MNPNEISTQEQEKALRKYSGVNRYRNAAIFMGVVTLAGIAVLPVMMGSALLAVILWVVWVTQKGTFNDRLTEMQAAGTYEAMLQDFAAAESLNGDRVRCGKLYVFGKNSIYFYGYSEIRWLYKNTTKYLFIPLGAEVMIGNGAGDVQTFCKLRSAGKAGDAELEALTAIVKKQCPKVLLGFNADKEAEYQKRVKNAQKKAEKK